MKHIQRIVVGIVCSLLVVFMLFLMFSKESANINQDIKNDSIFQHYQ